jgi:hypothetical protein
MGNFEPGERMKRHVSLKLLEVVVMAGAEAGSTTAEVGEAAKRSLELQAWPLERMTAPGATKAGPE